MEKESKEFFNDTLLVKASQDSYIKKEDLIKMIENLNFSHVKELTLELITGFKIEWDNDNKKYIRTLGYRIDIR